MIKHKCIRDIVERAKVLSTPIKIRWIITGTEISNGSKNLDHSFEFATSVSEAWAQAIAHSAGTNFTPETIERSI